MKILRKMLLLLLLAGAFSTFAGNPARIAVVDLEKVFREFYKSRIAEEQIKKQAAAYRSYIDKLNKELQAIAREAQIARSNALNIALSEAEKRKAEETAAAKNRLFREKEAEIKQFIQERSQDMRRLEAAKRAEIIREIRAEIRKRAAAEGFEYVFDNSGKTMNDQPSLLVFPAKYDITNSVIRELNRTRTQPSKK